MLLASANNSQIRIKLLGTCCDLLSFIYCTQKTFFFVATLQCAVMFVQIQVADAAFCLFMYISDSNLLNFADGKSSIHARSIVIHWI